MPCVQTPNQHSGIGIDKPSTSQQSENVQQMSIPIQEITDLQRDTHTFASLSTSTGNQNRSTTSTSNTTTISQAEHNQTVDDDLANESNDITFDDKSNNTENFEGNQGIFLQLPAINSCHHFIH